MGKLAIDVDPDARREADAAFDHFREREKDGSWQLSRVLHRGPDMTALISGLGCPVFDGDSAIRS